jgi:hypothetical protein
MADIDISSYAIAVATAVASLTIGNASLSAHGYAKATSTGSLTVKNQLISASAVCRATTTAFLTVRNQYLKATAAARCTSSGTLRVSIPLSSIARVGEATSSAYLQMATHLAATGAVTCTASAALNSGRDGLGVCDVIREILLLWGIEYPCAAPDFAKTRALNDLNGAMQLVWNQARDRNYWTREQLTISLGSGVSSQVLSDSVQNVIGPARMAESLRPLSPIGTRAELDQFIDLFLDGDTPEEPVAYYIERLHQAGKDPVKCTFHVAPSPTENTDFLLDVVNEAPRFSINDIDACPRIPIPHLYVETLLLPIVRFQAMNFHLFVGDERREQIAQDYAAARGLLEEADPLPGKAGDNTNRREEAKTT